MKLPEVVTKGELFIDLINGVEISLFVKLQEKIFDPVVGVDRNRSVVEIHLAEQSVVTIRNVQEIDQCSGQRIGRKLGASKRVTSNNLVFGSEEAILLGEQLQKVSLGLGKNDAVGGGIFSKFHRPSVWAKIIKSQASLAKRRKLHKRLDFL
jgi:hypothetical protein